LAAKKRKKRKKEERLYAATGSRPGEGTTKYTNHTKGVLGVSKASIRF